MLLTTEVKATDVAVAVAANTTGAITLLNGLVPGVGFSQRIGRKIKMMKLELNVTNRVEPTTGIDQTQRCLVVLDRQADGTAPAITDILHAVTVDALTNFGNSSRFRVLLDKRLALSASAEANSIRVWNQFLMVNQPTWYNTGTAGTVADIVSNSLYFVSIGSVAAGGTAGAVAGSIRLLYTDE